MNVWMLPKHSETNKYNSLFSDSIEQTGVNVKNFRQRHIFRIKNNDILHFHWIHSLYQSNYKLFFIIKSIILIMILKIIKVRGGKIVWTVHNLYPHSFKFKKLEKWIRQKVMKECDFLVVAAHSLKLNTINEFQVQEEKIKVIPHGHYQNAYKTLGTDIRKKYNISKQNYVYLFLGAIKPYKGVDNLIESFLEMAKKDQRIDLIIAGNASQEFKKKIIKKSQHNRVHLDLRFVPDDEIADIISASDAVVLPYEEITTSGSAILALSFYKPIVAPKTPFLEEYFDHHNSVLYTKRGEQSLVAAMGEVKELSESISHENFKESLERLEWTQISENMVVEYNKIKTSEPN
ncbi:glycosyltransferase family 4 protein [Priestia aryabhattai]|uniref:glycosyltransferase family 4 protein n=1 Tax=Priestia aryabhattai TaxID=412384 RepID=UPI002E1F578D|nr:glycosyltransferase family 4 protein [Priestia aryabhattai]